MSRAKPPGCLKRGFVVTSHNPREWKIKCRTCGQAWALLKTINHPGNLLRLLEHEASHGEKGTRK